MDSYHIMELNHNSSDNSNAVVVKHLTYKYSNEHSPNRIPFYLNDISFVAEKGSRVLLVGTNGAGKSTLLSILGGNKLIPEDQATIFNRPVFHDFSLKKIVSFLGDPWNRDYCYGFTLKDLLKEHANSERVQMLATFLDIDLDWPLAYVSDGQRRRSQLLYSFINPKEVYLLDEVTTDLDLLARDGLFRLLRHESEKNDATIIYATHIFDDMEGWPTHILHISNGQLKTFSKLDELKEYQDLKKNGSYNPLYLLIRNWFIEEKNNPKIWS